MNKYILIFLSFFNLGVHAQHISVDVGHYLESPGTITAYGDHEFAYNRKLAKSLAEQLVKDNFSVNLIGYNGDMSDLNKRAPQASQSALMVSIHHDALQAQDLSKWIYKDKELPFNDDIHGFGVFVSTKNPQFEKSLQCAKIIATNLMTTGFTPNYYHARDIANERKHLFFNNLPVYQYDNLIVLKTANVPALLIEAGVLTNRQEAVWITQENIQLAFSQAVSLGIQKCLRN